MVYSVLSEPLTEEAVTQVLFNSRVEPQTISDVSKSERAELEPEEAQEILAAAEAWASLASRRLSLTSP